MPERRRILALSAAAVVSTAFTTPSFAQLVDSVTAPIRAVHDGPRSAVAFFIPEKDLLPESVAFDLKDGSFYVGSARKGKIVRIDKAGTVTDFVAPRQDGLWMVIGMKIHATRRMLWACSADGEDLEGFKPHDGRATGVFAFNLDTGTLIRKWVLDEPGVVHGFNDLVVTRGGDVFITHMIDEAAVYTIDNATQTLSVFAHPEGLKEPNGIAITPDERTLFVADATGVVVIDRESRVSRRLQVSEGDDLGGIDGLCWYRGSLIGVHTASVCRHMLDEAMTRVTLTEVLERNHPLYDIPTTGVLVGDDFFYIANGQFDAVRKDGTLKPMDELNEPAILKLPLK